jgi:hypothetical protein
MCFMQTVVEHESRTVEGEQPRKRSALNVNGKNAKMTVYIKSSRKIVSMGTMNTAQPTNRFTLLTFSSRKRFAVEERVLDEDQKAVLGMSSDLAKKMGIELEVKDEGRFSFSHLLDVLLSRSWPKAPSVSFTEYGGRAQHDISDELRNAIQNLGQRVSK